MLSQSSLKSSIEGIYQQLISDRSTKFPAGTVTKTAAQLFSSAYHSYASSATASTLGPIAVPGSVSALEESLSLRPFAAGWTQGLRAYWSPTVWTDMVPVPIHIPRNPINSLSLLQLSGMESELQSAFDSLRDSTSSVSSASERIAMILHSYTTRLTVDALPKGKSPPPIQISIS